MSELAALARKLDRVDSALDGPGLRPVLTKVGAAGKADLLAAGVRTLGADRRFSGWPRGGTLSAGYDLDGNTVVVLKPRPYGIWMVAESGRHKGVAPKRRKQVTLMTPWGPRTYLKGAPLQIGSTRGHGTLTDAHERIAAETPGRIFDGVQEQLRKAWN